MSDELNRREVERVVNNLVGEVDRLRRAQESSARAQSLRNAAIDGGDGLVVRDENGVDVYRLGVNPETGTVAPQYAPGPIPNQPSAPLVTAGAIASQVALDGLDVEENAAPEDFRHAEVHFSLEEGFEPSLLTLQGVVTEPRGTITVARPAGLWHVRVVWVTLSGQRSAPSDPALVDIEPLVDTADIEQALDTARAELAAATAEADAQFAELGRVNTEAQAALDAATARLEAAEATLAPLPGDVTAAQEAAEAAADAALAAEARATEANNRAMTRLANGNFEDGLKYWAGTATLITDSHSGGNAVEVGGPSSKSIHPESLIPVVAGQIWELQFHYKALNAEAQNGRITGVFRKQDGTTVGAWLIRPAPAEGAWGAASHRLTVPEGVDAVRPSIARMGSETNALWAVDDVVMRDVTDVVRLEQAAQAAKKAGDDAMAQAKTLELAMGGLDTRLSTAEGNITATAEQAAEDLSALDTALRDAFADADAAVQSAAATDATNKADAARTAAEAEALRLAQAEAAAAQSAAEAEALRLAADEAEKARVAAVSAASSDATAKAEAARIAAEAAATADAKAKADAAQAEAIRLAAVDAQTKADAAQAEALRLAKLDATAKANSVPRPFHETAAPTSANAAPDGSVWFQHTGSRTGPVIAQWARVAGAWVSTPIRSEAIANLDVGKLTAGSATVAETVTQKLLANEAIINRLTSAAAWIGGTIIKDGQITAPKITVTNDLITKFFAANRALINEELVVRGNLIANHATAISAALKNLSVTEKATFAQAFADEFWAKMAVIDKLTAATAWIGGAMLKDGAVTAEKITATESLTAKVAQFLKVKAGMIEANAFEGQTFTGGTFTGSRFQSHTAANAGVKMDGTGFHAFDASGGETFRVNGSNNLIVGEIATSTPGTPGLIVQAANHSTQKPALFFSADGTDSGTNAAVYADSDWNLRLRGRDMGYGRSRIRVDGGLEVINGGGIMAGNQITGDMGGITGDGKGTFMGLEVAGAFSYFYYPIRYPGAPTTTQPGNLWKSPTNDSVYVSTSRRAGKVNIETVEDELPDRLLDLDPRIWLDRTELSERLGDRDDMIRETPDGPVVDVKVLDEALENCPRRVPGLVAEEVLDAGLDDYVTYATGDDGVETVQGVAYDRLWTLLIPLVRRQREQIDALEDRLAALEDRLAAPEDRASARGRR